MNSNEKHDWYFKIFYKLNKYTPIRSVHRYLLRLYLIKKMKYNVGETAFMNNKCLVVKLLECDNKKQFPKKDNIDKFFRWIGYRFGYSRIPDDEGILLKNNDDWREFVGERIYKGIFDILNMTIKYKTYKGEFEKQRQHVYESVVFPIKNYKYYKYEDGIFKRKTNRLIFLVINNNHPIGFIQGKVIDTTEDLIDCEIYPCEKSMINLFKNKDNNE